MACDPPIHPFERATSVTREAGQIRGAVDAAYWAFVGPFGGTTAATLLRALLDDPARAGDPIALTVNFAAPLALAPFEIRLRQLRVNRSTQHWLADVAQDDDPQPKVGALAVFGDRRPGWSRQVATPRPGRDRAALPAYNPGEAAAWTQQYEFRFRDGEPAMGRADPSETSAVSEVWIADRQPRVVDLLSLAAMADAFFARIFHVRGEVVPFGTVSMTTYFHATSGELAEYPCNAVLGRATASRFHRSYSDQLGELWSPEGTLLATTHQVAFFKA